MAEAEQVQPVFSIEKLYTKDVSLEIPGAPQIFLERDTPQIDVQLHNSSGPINEGYYEAVLTVTVTAKLGEKTMFLTEVAQAGIFQIRNVPEADLPQILGIACPNIIFPYAREVISDLVTRAGFPPVLLNPVNFEALYQAQMQQAQTQAQAAKH
jgi:preprotein translocase subunit SecB